MPVLPQRRIGRDGPVTGVLSLGSWHTYDRMDFAEAVTLLRTAIDAGITLYDTGVYSPPGAPPVVTDVLFSAMVRAAGLKRDDYLLSVKLWLDDVPERPLRGQLANALMRAGADHADLVILGDVRRADTDLGAVVAELAGLRADGLVGRWGVNNWSASAIRAAHDHAAARGAPGPAIAQLKYGVARRAIADGAPFARVFAELGVTLQASDVFEGGVLLGNDGASRQVGRDPGGVRERIAGSAADLRRLAESLGATPAQFCLAFALTHPAATTALFGASSTAQLTENLGALDLLDRVGAAELRALAEPFWADRDAVDPEGP